MVLKLRTDGTRDGAQPEEDHLREAHRFDGVFDWGEKVDMTSLVQRIDIRREGCSRLDSWASVVNFIMTL